MQFIKLVIGIDVSKDTFTACLGIIDIKQCINIISSDIFKNDIKGFMKLLSWLRKIIIKRKLDDSLPKWFVMESTGIYYENLAYFLVENNCLVSVILPNKMKSFLKTLESKTKTDEQDAVGITRYGLEKSLFEWKPPSPKMKVLKELLREYQTLKLLVVQVKNRLHAKKYSHEPEKLTVTRLNQQKKFYNKQLNQIKKQIEDLIAEDKDLKSRIEKIKQVEGLGLISILTVITETNGFVLVKNGRQLASYAGYDVVHNQSGLFTGKSRISGRGNSFIRKAMYMPALTAVKYNPRLKQLYIRLVMKKSSKKIALIAVARKLLLLIFTLWKKNEDYIPNYQA